MHVLRVEGLTAGYGKAPIVSEVSFHASVSQVVTLIGPNGAGKSTALKATFGLIPRMAGRVYLDETDITALGAHQAARAGMAYVPQVDNVFASMSVEENLELGGFVERGSLDARKELVFEIFPALALARKRKAGQLSGGQRNMLGMGRALMSNPKVVLLDEPTAGLSPANVDVVWSQIAQVAALGTTVVVVEQNVERALTSADWVYILVAGRNLREGTPAELAKLDMAAIFLGQSGGAEEAAVVSSGERDPLDHG